MSVIERFVEVGRVALVTFGEHIDKICTIVEIVDHSRVIVDGPESVTGVPRAVISLKFLSLTNLKVTIEAACSSKDLEKALASEDIIAKWDTTNKAKRMKRDKIRADLSDFQRFQVKLLKKAKAKIVKEEVKRLVAVKKN